MAPRPGFLTRFQAAAVSRISQIPAPLPHLQAETAALDVVAIGPTRNRSVMGSLNNLRYLALCHLAREPYATTKALADALCTTPMLTLASAFPWEQATALLGGDMTVARQRVLDAT
jgi:hypothetical protein